MDARAPSAPFVIAVDAGGTHTRVGCFDARGALLASAVGLGGSPQHNRDSERNVADTLAKALSAGGLEPSDAVGLAAGVAAIERAGSDHGGSNEWAEQYFDLPSLSCPRVVVNDAVAAHRGALLGQAGIIVVAGTGSMIMAISAHGLEFESGQFEHYAGGARHLAFDAIQLILAGASTPDDDEFVAGVLDHWRVTGEAELRNAVLSQESADRHEVKRLYGRMAPLITAAADRSPLADHSLRRLAERTALGVAVLAPLVGETPVRVATAGALATDAAFTARLVDALAELPVTPTRLSAPSLDPLRGAALLAYSAAGIPWSPSLIDVLGRPSSGGRPALTGLPK